jgi:hypothetical protein
VSERQRAKVSIRHVAVMLVLALSGCRHNNGRNGWDSGVKPIVDMSVKLELPDGFESCAMQTESVQTLGADVVFLMDTSYSMDYDLKWATVSVGLEQFLQDPKFTGIGVGLQRFPIVYQCDIPSYGNLLVPIATLPGNYAALKTQIDSWRMAGGTPTVPALWGVLQAASTNAAANPMRKQILVIATDGVPDDSCAQTGDLGLANTIASAVDLVKAANQATPPVTTFVIGVGSALSQLDAIAAAGGGLPHALLVDTTQNIGAEFSAALDQIRKVAFSCDFPLPAPPAGLKIDPAKVNVTYQDPMAAPHVLVNVGDASGCAKAPNSGWYYDDPTKPSKATLCAPACDLVRSAATGEVDITYGCAIIIQ